MLKPPHRVNEQPTIESPQPTVVGGLPVETGQPTTGNSPAATGIQPTTVESGQATAEYALVIVAAAAIALALILWATSTGALADFFDSVVAKVASYV